jgi:lipid II:glycine glycyltransferase (peptidoglycan interpeptide bridge formation enzyme)
MDIKTISEKKTWAEFLAEEKPHTFLQSWEWGKFQERQGNKIWRFGTFDGTQCTGVALIIKVAARRGTFLFCPHGPIFKKQWKGSESRDFFPHLVSHLAELAKKEGAGFIRFSPLCDDTEENRRMFGALRFRPAPIHLMHPESALMVDLARPEEEIFSGFRKQTKTAIRQAAALGGGVMEKKSAEDLAAFYKLYEVTTERHGFVPFSREYLAQEFEAFSPGGVSLFFSRFRGEVLAAAFIVCANGSMFYHHGASAPGGSKIPVGHLLQWEIIREAKKRGFLWYNLWGVAPEGVKNHPWAGLTVFKRGFGGVKETYLHAQDFVVRPVSYRVTFLIEKARKIWRGL